MCLLLRSAHSLAMQKAKLYLRLVQVHAGAASWSVGLAALCTAHRSTLFRGGQCRTV